MSDLGALVSNYVPYSKSEVKKWISDAAANTVVAVPFFAGMETIAIGMPVAASIEAKVIGVASYFAGVGYLTGKGRDRYRAVMGITDDSSKKAQAWHDFLFFTAIHVSSAPLVYYAVGVRDPQQLVLGTSVGLAYGIGAGIVNGYTLDLYRDLLGIEGSHRVPSWLRNGSKKFKRSMAALIAAGAFTLTVGIWAYADYRNCTSHHKSSAAIHALK